MRSVDSEGFLPVSKQDMERLGIRQLDFVYVIGDAYVDHPSFGHAIISRVLTARGFTVGIIAQPDWKDPACVEALGEPRLAFLVSSGNMDSMVNHYTVAKRRRNEDAYSPGGRAFLRPDRAVMVYSNLIRSRFKHIPVIAGGLEASLRRMAHYDYWSDSLRRSLLMECGADIISYGMGEKSIVALAEALDAGLRVRDITFVPGTCFVSRDETALEDCILLPSYEELLASKEAYARSFYVQQQNNDPFSGERLAERYGNAWVIQNPPAKPLTQQEMDDIYALPYMRREHPMYREEGATDQTGRAADQSGRAANQRNGAAERTGRAADHGKDACRYASPIPALEEVRFSLVSNRGCFGGCSFCALTFHQGRILQTRSHESILAEAQLMIRDPQFKGYIHDVGGPTANFRQPACKKQLTKGVCKNRQCLFPEPCPNLEVDHKDYIALLRKLRALPGVKKVFVRSGIRFDYVCADPSDAFLRELVQHHISGQLKVAPEHVSDPVLKVLGKPPHAVYTDFVRRFEKMNKACGMKQFLVPYLMSSHPGCTLRDAVALAEYLRDIRHMPEQVQDFYPTPSTLSTVMYYTGLDPRTMKKVYVPRDPHEKAMQRALMQYALPRNRELVLEALKKAGREELIGYGPGCLVPPDGNRKTKTTDRKTGLSGPGRKEAVRKKDDGGKFGRSGSGRKENGQKKDNSGKSGRGKAEREESGRKKNGSGKFGHGGSIKNRKEYGRR